MVTQTWKNYSLSGGGANSATQLTDDAIEDRIEKEWFSAVVDRKEFKGLIKRTDSVALGHTLLWLVLLVTAGVVAYFSWDTWWTVPAFATYGVLYSVADHRHHELSHGTPFRTRWLNDALFHLTAFMTFREGFYYRWSHSRHHTHTLIVGRDPEIAVPRPPDLLGIVSDLFFIKDGLTQIARILRNAVGDLSEDGKDFIPESERGKVSWASRVYVLIFLAVIAACVLSGSILPAMFVVLPRFYGSFLSQIFNLTQHAGLDEDVYDHRLNTRTIILNPVLQFLYNNMNYHVEHHMFPMVPFYMLPRLHLMIRSQCPRPYVGLGEVYREIIPILIRQTREPSFYAKRIIPTGALRELKRGTQSV